MHIHLYPGKARTLMVRFIIYKAWCNVYYPTRVISMHSTRLLVGKAWPLKVEYCGVKPGLLFTTGLQKSEVPGHHVFQNFRDGTWNYHLISYTTTST
jgi:hypothetical protein